tara:strand:+ start:50 stop:1054 length:1005 start_codon:yes stop_codon:yes gene_type:complete
MARIVKVDGDYKVSVTSGNTITLDTGVEAGKTVVTGDLEVKGTTQTISSVNTTIADNILRLNEGETGPGVSASNNYQAGIEIDRGSNADVRWVFDDNVAWQIGGDSGEGLWLAQYDGGAEGYIKTTGIAAGGTLYVQTGNGVISVTNSNSYEEKVFTYSGGSISDGGSGVIIDDDIIPNTKAVTDYVAYYLANESSPSIVQNDSEVRVKDFQTTGSPSEVDFKIDNTSVAKIFVNRSEFGDIRLSGSTISTTSSNQNLIFEAQGTGTVQVNDVLQLSPTPGIDDPLTDPAAPATGVKIYSKSASTGDTGIYYTNNSKQDEIISRNRALVLSMIF